MGRAPLFMVKKPCTRESDVPGVVAPLSPEVKDRRVGDKVYGITPAERSNQIWTGGLARYTLVRETNLYPPCNCPGLAADSAKPGFLS